MPWDVGHIYRVKRSWSAIWSVELNPYAECHWANRWVSIPQGAKVLITRIHGQDGIYFYSDGFFYWTPSDDICGRLEEINDAAA